jgi:serine/threonine protein phosphatase PrpC
MGCRVSKAEPVAKPRRRLTVADTNDEQAHPRDEGVGLEKAAALSVISGDSGTQSPDQLLLALEQCEILNLRKNAMKEMRWSFSSETDNDLHRRPSRKEKDTSLRTRGAKLTMDDIANQGVGVACTKGLKPEVANQDSFVCICCENSFRLYGVFDGHGKQGHFVSQYVKEQLPKLILESRLLMESPDKVLEQAFERMQVLLEVAMKQERFDCRRSGCTATVVLHFVLERKLVVAHVGDSRAVMSCTSPGSHGRVAKELTQDHRPDLEVERKRIEAGGGFVRFDGAFNHRVYAADRRVHGPGLNMSRALGDFVAHIHAGVTAKPDVSTWTVNDEDKQLLLCSDGIWEFITSQQACDTATQANTCSEAALLLADLAWTKWRSYDPYTVDDITAMVIDMQVASALAKAEPIAMPTLALHPENSTPISPFPQPEGAGDELPVKARQVAEETVTELELSPVLPDHSNANGHVIEVAS